MSKGTLGLLSALLAGTVAAQADELKALRYEIERLGGARTVEVASPGAGGSAQAVRLTHAPDAWSRFNWPAFRPVPRAETVRLSIRREGELPRKAHVRVLCADGVEWQSGALTLEETWRTVNLTAADFKVFRGADANSAGGLALAEAVQLQVVPVTGKAGGCGILWVDELRLLPEGPAFTHEGSELRRVVTDPAELELDRLNDLRKRWSDELVALEDARQGALRWNGALADVLGLARAGDVAAAQRKLDQSASAWLQPVSGRGGANVALAPLSREAFGAGLATCAASETRMLADYSKTSAVRRHTMYRAPKQAEVEFFRDAGTPCVRQRVRFSGAAAQQVVFVTVDLPAPETDVSGRRLFVRMRCTAAGLNERQPLVLRLYSKGADSGESWAQFKPQTLPGAAWGECVFPLESPVQSVRFNPRAVRQLALRVENVPGRADDFVVEMAPVRLGWPEPLTRVRSAELEAIGERVRAAREALFCQRTACVRLEDELRAFPDVSVRYWSSFEQTAPRRGEPVSPVFARDEVLPLKPVSPEKVRACCRIERGGVHVEVRQSAGADGEIAAELRSPAGDVVAAGRCTGSQVRLSVPQAALWRAGNPCVHEIVARVTRHGETVAFARKPLGLRVSEIRPSGGSTVLRQAVLRRWPDWSFRRNGQGDFGRFACYDLPGRPPSDNAMRKLFDDLWVDGVRHYGFGVSVRSCGWYDRQGIAQLASVAPGFRSLSGWAGLESFCDGYADRCALLDGAGDSASVAVLQVGNEVELAEWGCDLSGAFPLAPYQPLDAVAETVKNLELTTAPVMYVRAGRFTVIPPMPHEDVCGVNQYTGRYSGRMDEIERDLAELSVQAMFANRPLMITEWSGPKYSWASGGVGGVTTRGAAYYLERYWRGMIDTPGIVGSSEFTLNWVIAPFEDLTNLTRAEAWKNRPKHSRFSEPHPADHIPLLMPGQVVPDECYRAMQAFHGPLYVMMQRPGAIAVAHGAAEAASAQRLAASLAALGKEVLCRPEDLWLKEARHETRHVVALLPTGSLAQRRLEQEGVIEAAPADGKFPVIQTRVHPYAPDRLLVTLTAPDAAAFADGVERLGRSAEELFRLRRLEGAMGRVMAVTDAALTRVYERYVLELAARGYLVAGDDTRLALKASDFYGADGRRRAAWSDWAALILDCARELSADELSLTKRVCGEGVNVVVSRACYRANPGLQAWCEASLDDAGSLAGRFELKPELSGPVPVRELGGADAAVIARFSPTHAHSKALGVSRVTAREGAQPLALAPGGEPVVVAWPRGKGRVFLFGCDFGAAAGLHWEVTHAGRTHSLYDRDTACGLERGSRCVINACLCGRMQERLLPRLYVRVVPDDVRVRGGLGAVAQADVLLCDVEGRPVSGEVLARARVSADGTSAGEVALAPLQPVAPGRFRVVCAPVGKADARQVGYVPAKQLGALWTVLSLQLKAYAEGHVPADGAAAFIVTE